MKFQLVDDINLIWKKWSTRIAASQAALVLFWTGLPHELRNAVPEWVLTVAVALFGVSFICAQSVKQPSLQSARAAAPPDKEGDKKDVG